MASTIKLKTSTSSGNVPASLAKGEVAINVADGVWYYGGASAVQQNFNFGSVTVTGNTSLDGKLVVTGNTVMNGTLSASSVNVGNGAGSVSAATITSSGDMTVGGDLDVDGVFNVDNMDIDGTFTMDGTTFDVNATTTLTLDNTNTTNGIAIGTSTSGVPIQLGHSTSETRVNDNLVVTGNTVMNGTLSATTSCKIGNGDGLISAATVSAPVITGTLSTAAQTNITSLGTLTNLNVDNININGDTITSSGDLEIIATGNDITVDTDNFTIESAASVKPSFTLKSTINSNKPAVQQFVKDKGAAGADGDIVGETYYIGDNDAQEQITMVQVTGQVSDASDGAEEGEYVVKIKNTAHVSTLQESFKLTGNGALTDATIGFGATSTTTIAGDLVVTTDLDVDGVTNLDNIDIDGTFTMDGTAFDVNGTTTVAIDNTNTTNGVTINTVTSGSKVFIGHTTSETTVNDNLNVTGDLAVDGTANLDNTDIDGTLVVDGSNISLDSTSTLNIDNSNTSNGITIGTATSGVPIQLGHSTSNVRINDNLVVTGNTVMNGTLSATTSLNVGNGNGTISASSVTGTILKGILGSDAAPVTAYINNGEIDGTTLGGESAVTIAGANYIDIENSAADNVALSVIGHSSQSASILEVKDGGEEGTLWFGVAANGRCTINSGVMNGGTINNTSIGATTPNTGVFTTVTASGEIDGGSLDIEGNADINGIANLDNTDIDGTLVVDGSNISLDSTSTFNIDNSNTTNGITIGTATSGVPIQLGHSTSETRINDNLVVTGNTVMNGTLSATTSCKIGNGDGLISGETVSANAFIGAKHILRSMAFYINDNPMVQNNLYFGSSLGNTPSNWQDPQAVGGTISAVASFTIIEDDMNWGMILPFDVSKVEVTCSLRPNLGSGDDFTIAMYTGIRSDDSNTALTLTKVAIGQTTFTTQRYVTNDITYTANLNAGTMIYVGVGSEDATDAKNARGLMNIVITER